jgi:hypothetical protein
MPPKTKADERLAALRQAVTSAPKYGMNGRALLLEATRQAAAEESDEDDEGGWIDSRLLVRSSKGGGPEVPPVPLLTCELRLLLQRPRDQRSGLVPASSQSPRRALLPHQGRARRHRPGTVRAPCAEGRGGGCARCMHAAPGQSAPPPPSSHHHATPLPPPLSPTQPNPKFPAEPSLRPRSPLQMRSCSSCCPAASAPRWPLCRAPTYRAWRASWRCTAWWASTWRCCWSTDAWRRTRRLRWAGPRALRGWAQLAGPWGVHGQGGQLQILPDAAEAGCSGQPRPLRFGPSTKTAGAGRCALAAGAEREAGPASTKLWRLRSKRCRVLAGLRWAAGAAG